MDSSEPEFDVARREACRVLSSPAHHVGRHVDTDHMTRLAYLSGSEKAVETAAGSEVEHALPGTKCSNGLWVSASEAHVGALRHGRQILCRVSELQARFGPGTA